MQALSKEEYENSYRGDSYIHFKAFCEFDSCSPRIEYRYRNVCALTAEGSVRSQNCSAYEYTALVEDNKVFTPPSLSISANDGFTVPQGSI